MEVSLNFYIHHLKLPKYEAIFILLGQVLPTCEYPTTKFDPLVKDFRGADRNVETPWKFYCILIKNSMQISSGSVIFPNLVPSLRETRNQGGLFELGLVCSPSNSGETAAVPNSWNSLRVLVEADWFN